MRPFSRRPRRGVLLSVAVLLPAALAGCGSDAGAEPAAGNATSSSTGTTTVTVLAAASLTGTFTDLAGAFEDDHPGTDVRLSFGPSSGLATQITNGAPADVFASASGAPMDQLVTAKLAASPTVFATNRLEIAVPADNPAGITKLADLAKPGVKVALCQVQVPCGAAAQEVLKAAGLAVTPVTEEADVKAALTKVSLGEVDAGLVYVTDVQAAGATVTGIEIPAADNAESRYPIAVLSSAKDVDQAQAFVAAVLSPAGRATLTDAGFGGP
jgi:molybdate transport system substrate-binding protein